MKKSQQLLETSNDGMNQQANFGDVKRRVFKKIDSIDLKAILVADI